MVEAVAKQKPEPIVLKPGERIAGWEIVDKLGEGGFGAVYKVKDKNEALAMKVERVNQPPPRVLKMEVIVLNAAKQAKATHFCELVDAGRANNLNFLVMTLVGSSLYDLRKQQPGQKFSLGCAVSVSMNCLEALEELHNFGFLHRDIKPSNFAIGVNLRKIFLLDFGMCRRYVDVEGNIKAPRAQVALRGTVTYASLSAHLYREQCRKDDLESWMYQTIEMTRGYLPWKKDQVVDEVAKMKEQSRKDLFTLMSGVPKKFIVIYKYIEDLRYYDTPDYGYLKGLMREIMVLCNVQEFPYDWEPTSPCYVPSKKQ